MQAYKAGADYQPSAEDCAEWIGLDLGGVFESSEKLTQMLVDRAIEHETAAHEPQRRGRVSQGAWRGAHRLASTVSRPTVVGIAPLKNIPVNDLRPADMRGSMRTRG
jgi:hypothetical protein